MRKRKRVWMAIRKGSGHVVAEWTELSRGADDDVIVTEVQWRWERLRRIVNDYNQRDTLSAESQAHKINRQSVILQGRTVPAAHCTPKSSW
jgi:hypothetical protein